MKLPAWNLGSALTPHKQRRGLTLLELVMASVVLVVAVGGLMSTVVETQKLDLLNREKARAQQAAREVSAGLHATTFSDLFAIYNSLPEDDPAGIGTAPGSGFPVLGLDADPEDADGLVGEILFPTSGAQLREDVTDLNLGMPRDLNGDAVVDGNDHATDYVLLPVTVRLRWRGVSGITKLDFDLLLIDDGAGS